MIHSHISQALMEPSYIQLKDNLFIARFECMKIYSALYAVEKLLEKGIINTESILIESSSGVYAYALALACHKNGLKCHILASKVIDSSLKEQLLLLGAKVEYIKKNKTFKMDQQVRIARVKQLNEENKNYYWMQQYHDPIHYLGYEGFAESIMKNIIEPECVRKITVVGGVGSGCSTGAVKDFLEKKGVTTTLIGIEPFGSVTFGSEHVEDQGMVIAGIGSSIEFRNVRHDYYDYIHWMSFAYGKFASRKLMSDHGIFAGVSCGASYLVADWNSIDNDETHLIIGADLGHRYSKDVFESENNLEEILPPIEITEMKNLQLPWSFKKTIRI